MSANLMVLMRSEKGRRLVREKCKEAGLEMWVLERLIELELDQAGKLKKRGLRQDFDEIFGEADEAKSD